MFQKLLICLVFFCTTHGLFAQKSESANLFNLGAPVAASEDNLKNFLESFPLYIENAQAVALIDYNYVGAIKNGEEARNYVKANFNGPLFAPSDLVIDQHTMVLFEEDESADKDALQKGADNYADEFVKTGYQVYAINYVYEAKTYTYYVFINPETDQVVTEKNMFGFDVPADRLAVIVNLRAASLRATTAIVAGALEKATTWMVNHANDDRYGYDQTYRWGELSVNRNYFPTGAGTRWDYDCSSGVISAWQNSGVGVKSAGATYTGNMRSVFIGQGFNDVTGSITLSSGAGLKRGDVLLNTTHHTGMFIGSGNMVHVSINEKGTATGGNPGDQTTKEFCTRSYYNYPWNCILRYPDPGIPKNLTLNFSSSSTTNSNVSTSQVAGSTVYLWINDGSGTAVNRQNCTLTSSNTGVATISIYGTIVAVSAGSTTIKAVRNSDKVEGSITLTVTPNNSGLRLVLGDSPNAPYGTLYPSPATISYDKKNAYLGIDGNNNPASPTWLSRAESTLSSSNEAVATIASTGSVTLVGNGTTTIKAVNGGRTGTINLTVTGAPVVVGVNGVTVNPTSLNLVKGKTSTLIATVSPSNANNKNVTWSSDTPGVATVSASGVVTAAAAGYATITVTTVEGGYTATCAVVVTNDGGTEAVTSVDVNPASLSLNVGETSTLTATVHPSDASNRNVNWSSGNSTVATVDNTGKVTAKAAGTATITAASAENSAIKGSCVVTVLTAGPTANGQLTLKIVARKAADEPAAAVTDPSLLSLTPNTPASATGSGCLFINDNTGVNTAVTRVTKPGVVSPEPSSYTSYEIYPAGMATVSDWGGITTFGDCLLTIKATNAGREGKITIPVGSGTIDVGIATPQSDAIQVFNTGTGIAVQFKGNATVELYTVNGILIDKVQAVRSYTRDLAKGVYILRVNGKAQKFVR